MSMNRPNYQSDHWKALKWRALLRSNENKEVPNVYGHCERCGYSPYKACLQLHHLHYNTVGKETLEDVQLVCPNCHKELTLGQVKGN